ncbi:hypothetical protein G7083_12625 (plasmid) [Vibrio sp. HDW18]|uniref:hypothetical protein n=1 Tax=Vibrio sp. HDW18 TaxID=2714948 RepID=UPI00140E02DA|nr:hypothetical protein [Vibrio sp. HDW18]QIL86741.1 hypothetical protein G7083_12625 [Vibrio sp. HDW18]
MLSTSPPILGAVQSGLLQLLAVYFECQKRICQKVLTICQKSRIETKNKQFISNSITAFICEYAAKQEGKYVKMTLSTS